MKLVTEGFDPAAPGADKTVQTVTTLVNVQGEPIFPIVTNPADNIESIVIDFHPAKRTPGSFYWKLAMFIKDRAKPMEAFGAVFPTTDLAKADAQERFAETMDKLIKKSKDPLVVR